ncbi:MAG TPA: TRAP transporter permease DctM/Q, partial [Thalassospira sp.]|nr:TRAP transporter permease DctM/Q [Thalassospira sp.]
AMIANSTLIDLGNEPLWAVLAGLKVAVGLTAISFGLIAPRPFWMRIAMIGVGAAVIFAVGV